MGPQAGPESPFSEEFSRVGSKSLGGGQWAHIASFEFSGKNPVGLMKNSQEKTKGALCMCCWRHNEGASLVLKKGCPSCQKCSTPWLLGREVLATGSTVSWKRRVEASSLSPLSPEMLLTRSQRLFEATLQSAKRVYLRPRRASFYSLPLGAHRFS